MQDFIISIVLFFVFLGILKFMIKLLETAKLIKTNKERENWLKYGLISKKDLFNLDPFEFKKWCGSFLEKLGYSNVLVTQEKNDGGKDIVCQNNGETIYVECKKFGFPGASDKYQMVTRDIVQKLVGAMLHDRVYNGMIITTGLISDGAREYVKGLPSLYDIKLIDGDELIRLHRNLREKNIYLYNKDPEIDII